MYENENMEKVVRRLSLYGIGAAGKDGEITLELVSNEIHKPITLPTDKMEALLDKACASVLKLRDGELQNFILAWYIQDYAPKPDSKKASKK